MSSIVHVQIKDRHYYFKTLSSVFDVLSSEELGITYGSLRNYKITPLHPYKNSKCIIRKGTIYSPKK
jgi:hypothetical protein